MLSSPQMFIGNLRKLRARQVEIRARRCHISQALTDLGAVKVPFGKCGLATCQTQGDRDKLVLEIESCCWLVGVQAQRPSKLKKKRPPAMTSPAVRLERVPSPRNATPHRRPPKISRQKGR